LCSSLRFYSKLYSELVKGLTVHSSFIMASSSGNDFGQYEAKGARVDEEKTFDGAHPRSSSVVGSVREVGDNTHRKLKGRHIQLIGIGGTIGTALYVQIGRGLMNGGPAALFIAFSLW
jgi:amino acid transporter